MWTFATSLVIGGIAYESLHLWADFQSRKSRDAVAAQVRDAAHLQYWDIGIGMSKAQVRYLKGEPSEVIPADKANDRSEMWLYKLGVAPVDFFYDVYWSAEEPVGVIGLICQGNVTGNSPAFFSLQSRARTRTIGSSSTTGARDGSDS